MRPATLTNPSATGASGAARVDTRRQTLVRYASAATSVVAAALLRVPLHPILGNKVAFITLFPAIVFSAWVAGFGGGLFATLLSALIAAWFIIPPAASPMVAAPADEFSLVVFVLVGVAISVLGQTQHRAQRRAEDSARGGQERDPAAGIPPRRSAVRDGREAALVPPALRPPRAARLVR